MSKPKVILDAKGLLTHMYYRGSDPDSILDEGQKINTAGWGFSNWLEEYFFPLLTDFSPSDVIAVWDGGNDYRTALFPAYKEKRKQQKSKQPAKLGQQLKLLEDGMKVFLANIGAINVSCKGVEADDLIAALCEGMKDQHKFVYTVDADLLQLDDEFTHIFLKNVLIEDKYQGVPLNLIRLNKAMVGDKSDGYGGIHRFGEKAWEHIEKEYGYDGLQEIEQCIVTGNTDPLLEAVQATDDKILKHVLDNMADAKKFYKIASLAPEICFQFNGNNLTWPVWYTRVPNRQKTLEVMTKLCCPDMIDKLEDVFPQFTLVTEENVDQAVEHFQSQIAQSPHISFDYETEDMLKNPKFNEALPKQSKGVYVDVLSSKITGCSFNYGQHLQHTVYVSTMHKDTDNVDPSVVAEMLNMVAEKGKPLVAHNCSFEWLVTKLNLDLDLRELYDTAILSSYVNENDEMGLKSLAKNIFRYEQATYKETLEAAGANGMADLTGNQVLSYGCDDSLVTGHLFKLFQLITQVEGTWRFYEDYERLPTQVLSQAFETGVRIDYPKLEELHAYAKKTIEEGTLRIREILQEHCKEPNEAAAKAMDKADGDNLSQLDRYRDKKGLTSDAFLAMRQKRLLKWEESSVYVPYEEEYIPFEFLGTPTQLNIVIESLSGGPVEGLKLNSTSNKSINEFITKVRSTVTNEADNFVKWDEFLILLAEATPLKNRDTEQFKKLGEFCIPYLGEGKTVSTGDELNFNSPDQMKSLLYCKLALPVRRRTKVDRGTARDDLGLKGSPGTNEEAIQMALAEDCGEGNEWKAEVLKTMMEVKGEKTKISLYYRPYPLWQHPRDGMIHPAIKNCGTVTRRPTGSNPNILQVEKGPTRAVYLPRYNDHVIIATDFSGQELRITGSESNDPVLIDAYTGGGFTTDEDGMVHPVTKDIHSVTATSFAARIFQRELGTADFDFAYDSFREMLFGDDPKLSAAANLCRKMAKVVNFLIIYGGAASSLAMKLGIPEAFAEELYRAVFAAYQRLAPWQEETIQFARRFGYVKTAYGNLKHLTSDIRSRDSGVRSRQERQAVNQTIQGCAADILKVVLTESLKTNLWTETKSVMIAPVYDEIVASVPARNAFEYCERIQDIMNVTPPGHPIPMMAEVCIGKNWYEAGGNELGDRPSEKKVEACIDSFYKEEAAA